MKRLNCLKWVCFSLVLFGFSATLQASDYGDSLKKAQQLFEDNQFDQAEALWVLLAKQYPNDIRIQNNLAVLEIKKGQFALAKKRLESALQSQSRVGVALDNLNQIYAYEAQKAYKSVFKTSEITQPKGKLTSLADLGNLNESKLELAVWKQKQQAVLNVVENWRYAWASQDVSAYIETYQRNYHSITTANHAQWVQARTGSLTRPEFIKVKIDDIQALPIAPDLVRVTFSQTYQNQNFQDSIYKVLFLKLANPDSTDWKISKEIVLHDK